MQTKAVAQTQVVCDVHTARRSSSRAGMTTSVSKTMPRMANLSARKSVALSIRGSEGVVKASGSRHRVAVKAVAPAVPAPETQFGPDQDYSGIEPKGKALQNALIDFPSKKEILSVIPEHCFKRDTAKSLMYAAFSTALTAALGVAAWMYIPLQAAYWPAWAAYAIVTGTAATGCWVVAHECGHGAFSDNMFIQDTVGYILHSLLLVPYFSWQRSHAVHHSRTNHMDEGETHVPSPASKSSSQFQYKMVETFGEGPFAIVHAFINLVFGWPMYLLTGASGGPVRGKTNHFIPTAGAKGKHALFPGGWKEKVWKSDIGIAAMVGALAYWVYAAGSAWPMIALYLAPYTVTNMWLVGYTWLQHTDVDVPHFDSENWDWSKGTFMTIDRPYGPLIDFLHHKIGSTHVAHHLNHQIPHYHALEATNAVKKAWPDLYLYDPTPIHAALWRIACKCIAVVQVGNMYVWRSKRPAAATA